MENSAPSPPKTPASMDSPSLETLQNSFGNLRMNNGKVEIVDSATPQGNKLSSFLPLNGSLTGVLPSPELSDRGSIWSSLKKASLLPSFNGKNLNYAGCPPCALAENLNGGYAFGESYPFNWASPRWKSSPFNNVNLYPLLHPPTEAIATGKILLRNGFHNSNNESFGGLRNLQGNEIIALAMEEQSSRDLQDLVFMKGPETANLIFEGVIDNIFKLMTSQYGRYVFQKLIELRDENLLRRIMEKLTLSDTDIFNASVHRYGSYSMKKLIKVLEKSPLVTEVVKALSKKFWELMINQTGQHVILACLDVVDSQKNDMLYVEAIDKCLQLATHERGCVSLNSFISGIKGPRRDQLLNLICDQAAFLAQDPAGNFVVQCVLGLQNPAITAKIGFKLRGYYVKLSTQKGGSHLVEKCLRSSGLDHVVHEFLLSTQLFQVANHQYGNYVVQTALVETGTRCSPLHESLFKKLCSNLNSLQNRYGRNVLKLMTELVLP